MIRLTLATALASAVLGADVLGAQWWRAPLDVTRPTVAVLIGLADHRVDAGLGIERSSGPVFGGRVDGELQRGASLAVRAFGGTLDSRTPSAETRELAQLDATARLRVLPWLDASVAGTVRSYRSSLARQRWSQLALGVESGFPVAGDIHGTVGAVLIPFARVSGHAPPDLALGGMTGLRWHGDRLDLALSYMQERYDFPRTARGERLEEQGMLVLGAGYRLGGR